MMDTGKWGGVHHKKNNNYIAIYVDDRSFVRAFVHLLSEVVTQNPDGKADSQAIHDKRSWYSKRKLM